MSKESDIEDAIITFLKGNIPALNRAIFPYAGDTPGDWVRKNVTAFPAALMHVGEESVAFESEDQSLIKGENEFYIYVLARNPRSKKEISDGALDILESIRNVLHRHIINSCKFLWKSQGPLAIEDTFCIFYQKYIFNMTIIGA